MNNINIEKAIEQFEKYLDQFDRTDDKINLKIVHTYGVMEASKMITDKMNLSEEQQQLALLIALLHDIGRFEQLKRFQSFDDRLIDHAVLGVEILQKEDFIREFIPTNKYDSLIYTVLLNHNTFLIDPDVTGETLLQTKLIRDADKLDNYRVKETELFETLFSISQTELEQQKITPQIYKEFANHHLIMHKDRKTHLDMWISYIAFMYDFAFLESLLYLKEKNYIPILFNRISLQNEATQKEYNELQEIAIKYIENKLNN